MENNDNSIPGLEEKYSPGELSSQEGQASGEQYGLSNEHIPQKYQEIFRSLSKKVAMRDMFARIEEVKKAGIQRFYWRGMMDVCWNESSSLWEQPYNGQIYQTAGQDSGDVELHYPFNIYQAFGRGFISIVSQIPSVKMQATKLDSPDAMRIASGADHWREKIEELNDMDQVMEDTARLFWTDGRVSFYSRWVCDGARFGYEDEHHSDEVQEGVGEGGDPPQKKPRQPKGGELVTPYAVLECKVPINMRSQADFMYRQLSFEIDLTSAKAMYPWTAKKLTGGQPGPGEYNFDRTTRIATTQGIRLLTESGDTTQELPTWQRTWFRPAFFAEIEADDDRQWFQDNYPDGAMVAFVGEAYCESRNESMDDHWIDIHPLPGDGQATPSCGDILLPVQDAVCDMTDLRMETYMKSIPAIWCDKSVVDMQALSKQKAGPGAHYPGEAKDGMKMQDGFWPEPAPTLPADAVQFGEQLFAEIPQFLTGLYPAALGGSDSSNETATGIQLLQNQSKGQAGVAWRALRKAYCKSLEQLVRIGAYFRASEAQNGSIKLSVSGEEVEIDLEDLRDGNWACYPDGDEAYPNTHAEKQQAFKEFAAFAAGSPQGQQILLNPKNLVLAKNLNGLADLEVPGAASDEKQLTEIKQLLNEPPIPNQQVISEYLQTVVMAKAAQQPPPPPPDKYAASLPSIEIQHFDDDQAELTSGTNWVNSSVGQQMRRENPDGFLNVELHLMQHEARIGQKAQQAAQQALEPQIMLEKLKHQPPAPKSPSESINFKDLGPSGKIQVGKQAGLDLEADSAADLAGDSMGENEKPAAKPVTQ